MATFTICDAKPTEFPKDVKFTDYLNKHKIVTKNKGTLIDTSLPLQTVNPVFGHSFVSAAFAAYSKHYHLVIRPDDVWLSIVIAFANYVDAHANEMRSDFVDHDGKEELLIKIDREDYSLIINMFTNILDQKVKGAVREWLEPNFTTTTKNDKLVSGAALMGAMKNYYSYEVHIKCGLPEVTLEGTLEDWQKVREKANGLLKYDKQALLVKWHALLVPILDQFIESYKGNVDKDFWNQICNHIPGGSGPSYITDLINVFMVLSKLVKYQQGV